MTSRHEQIDNLTKLRRLISEIRTIPGLPDNVVERISDLTIVATMHYWQGSFDVNPVCGTMLNDKTIIVDKKSYKGMITANEKRNTTPETDAGNLSSDGTTEKDMIPKASAQLVNILNHDLKPSYNSLVRFNDRYPEYDSRLIAVINDLESSRLTLKSIINSPWSRPGHHNNTDSSENKIIS